MSNAIAHTTWSQIPVLTKMTIGARDAVGAGDKLTFRVGGRMRKVLVEYNRDTDSYDIELMRVASLGQVKTLARECDVYCDQLSGFLISMCNA